MISSCRNYCRLEIYPHLIYPFLTKKSTYFQINSFFCAHLHIQIFYHYAKQTIAKANLLFTIIYFHFYK